MQKALLACVLLVTGASCATVPPATSHTANAEDGPFHVIASAPPAVPAAVAEPPIATSAAGKVQLASGDQPARPEIASAAWQTLAPPPAPAPAPAPATGDAGAQRQAGEEFSTPTAPETLSGGMTLGEAIQIAMAANPTLPEAAVSIQQMRAEWSQAGYYPNPILYYVGSNLERNMGGGQHGLYVEQAIVTADKLDWNRAVASGAIAQATADAEAQRLRVEVDTTILFYRALGTQRIVEIAQRILDNADRGLTATRQLEQAGEAARADVLQAEILYQQSQVTLEQAKLAAEGAWRQLAAMLGRPNDIAVPLAGEFDVRQPEDFELVWQRIAATSPELQAAAARVQRMRARIGRENAQAIGDIDAQFSLQQDFLTNQALGYVQVGMATPFHHRNQGSIASAQAQYIRSCRDLERQTLELRSRFAAVYQEAASARVAVERYRESVLPSAHENLELTRSGYQRGEFDLLRLLTAQRTFAETNTQYIQSQIQLRSAIARIDGLLLTGGLSEPAAPASVGGFGGLADTPRSE
jgi:cobalt-zinc-cadmium efflux system outer membrane protein